MSIILQMSWCTRAAHNNSHHAAACDAVRTSRRGVGHPCEAASLRRHLQGNKARMAGGLLRLMIEMLRMGFKIRTLHRVQQNAGHDKSPPGLHRCMRATVRPPGHRPGGWRHQRLPLQVKEPRRRLLRAPSQHAVSRANGVPCQESLISTQQHS